jgi:hypothetical protein
MGEAGSRVSALDIALVTGVMSARRNNPVNRQLTQARDRGFDTCHQPGISPCASLSRRYD